MRKYTLLALLLLFGTAALLAQKPKPRASSNASARPDAISAKKSVTQEEADHIPRPSGAGGWASEERVSFMNSCMSQVSWSRDSAFGYCSCVLQRVESRYPTAVDARELPHDTIVLWAKQCLSPGGKTVAWNEAYRKNFLDNCEQTFLKSPGTTKAKAVSYCNCMLKKIEAAYPNPLDASQMSTDKVKAWAVDCLKQ